MTGSDGAMFAPAYGSAIVTGGGSGIGRAVTLALAERGIDVWIMGRRLERLVETAELAADLPGTVQTVTCDIREIESVRVAFATAAVDGTPQALVHAAAEVWPCAAERLTPSIFDAAVSSQLTGAFHVYSTWARALIGEGAEGVLVTYTSAVSGRETPGLSHSSATKAAIEGLVRTWALELGRYNLRFNALAPGLFPIETTLTVQDNFYDVDMFRSNVPLGRFGIVDEIVAPTLFLLSSGAKYVTGAVLHVDGGLRLRPWFGLTPESLQTVGDDL